MADFDLLEVDQVLVASGRTANTAGLGLEALGRSAVSGARLSGSP